MNEFSKEKKEEVLKKLAEKGVRGTCPMCGNKHFVLADGYFINFLQPNLNTINIGGPNIPTVPIACSNCGFISQHAIGVLGMLPKESKDEKKEEESNENK